MGDILSKQQHQAYRTTRHMKVFTQKTQTEDHKTNYQLNKLPMQSPSIEKLSAMNISAEEVIAAYGKENPILAPLLEYFNKNNRSRTTEFLAEYLKTSLSKTRRALFILEKYRFIFALKVGRRLLWYSNPVKKT